RRPHGAAGGGAGGVTARRRGLLLLAHRAPGDPGAGARHPGGAGAAQARAPELKHVSKPTRFGYGVGSKATFPCSAVSSSCGPPPRKSPCRVVGDPTACSSAKPFLMVPAGARATTLKGTRSSTRRTSPSRVVIS